MLQKKEGGRYFFQKMGGGQIYFFRRGEVGFISKHGGRQMIFPKNRQLFISKNDIYKEYIVFCICIRDHSKVTPSIFGGVLEAPPPST